MRSPPAARRLLSPYFAIVAVFAAFGVIGGIWSGSIPTIAKSVGLDNSALGVALTGLIIANVVAMSSGGGFAKRFSTRAVLLCVVPTMAGLSVLLLAQGQTVPPLFVPALLAFGVAQGLTDVFMNSEGSRIEAELGTRILSGLHGVCSLCIGLGAISGSLIAVTYGPLAAAPVLLATGAAAFWVVRRAIPQRPAVLAAAHGNTARALSLPVVLLGLAVGFENSGEIAALFWSAKLLGDMSPSLASIAGLGPAFFAACSAIVRFGGDHIRRRFGDTRVVVVSLIVAALGLLGVGLLPGFALRVAAFAVVGFGTACVIPCLFAIAAHASPEARAARLGYVSMIAGPPRVLAPLAFGWVSQYASMSIAFSLSSLLMLLALGVFLASQAGMARERANAAAST